MVDGSLSTTDRFGNRVEEYVRWRPGYPAEVTRWLVDAAQLGPGDAVADVGSGTGLFARDLLGAGLRVFGVEPSGPMRAAGEPYLAAFPGFVSRAGTAEDTGLPASSVRLVTAAQAFHWFRPVPTRAEFARILAPGGLVALIWNVRRGDTPFLAAYEALLLEHAPEYAEVGVRTKLDEEVIRAFFVETTVPVRERRFSHGQRFDRDGLRGRLLSSSYAPPPGAPGHDAMLRALDAVFDAHASGRPGGAGEERRVSFEYETRVFAGAVI